MTRVPRWIVVIACVGAAFILLPLVAIISRVNWPQFIPLITSQESVAALLLSLKTAGISTLLCLVFGVPVALVLARTRFPGQRVVRALVLLPLVLPPVVAGIALLYTFGRQGLLGSTLDFLGIQIAFSTTAVILAETFVAIPFLILSLEGALRTAGSKYEVVAATLGASPTVVLWRVTLPLIAPSLISVRFSRSPGRWASSAPPSPSPAACRA